MAKQLANSFTKPASPRLTPRRANQDNASNKKAKSARAQSPKAQQRGTVPTSDHLSTYFRDLSAHGLLTPEEERDLARAIEETELATWERLLSFPATTEYVLTIIEQRIDNSLAEFKSLRKVSATARKSRSKATKEKVRKAAHKCAQQMRSLDQDREHVRALMDELKRLCERGVRPQTKHPFATNTKTFAKYVEDVLRLHRTSARLRDEFVRANLRLVVTMARRYDRGVMPLADLIQEGNLGLMHAISRFDYRRGLRFSTYACWWIRHAIGRALADKSRAVRVPVHMIEAQQQLNKVKAQLLKALGRPPTQDEIAQEANLPIAKLNQMQRYLLGAPMSFDAPVHNEDGRTLGEILVDPRTMDWSPEQELTTRALSDRVHELMEYLSPIEADVLRQRFGLENDEERTFREIGDKYSLSRERIRQIQNAALGKLRRALNRMQ